MAIGYLKNARLYVGALDLSGLTNTLTLPIELAELDTTPINTTGSTTRMPGLMKAKLEFQGWREFGAGLNDAVLTTYAGGADQPFAAWTPSAADGGLAHFGRLTQLVYKTGAKVGELEAFTAGGPVTAPLVRGNSVASGAKTTTGTGTALQLGAVSAAQSVYAVLHVVAYSGLTSIAVKVQSAAANTFATPHDQITFSTATAVGAQWGTPVAGANTDTWWRAIWTIVGTGSATIAVTVGIQ